jgi:tetratricopeptide (TPR) repeat protein
MIGAAVDLFTGIAISGTVGGVLMIMVLWTYAGAARQRQLAAKEAKDPPPEAALGTRQYVNQSTITVTVFTLALLICLSGEPALLLVGAVVAVVLLGLIAMFVRYRWRTRLMRQVCRMAVDAGDTEGAIALLRARINRHGPTAEYCDALAVLLGSKGQWGETLALLEQADELAGTIDPRRQSNEAVALWKLGRLQAALLLLQDAQRARPNDLLHLCNLVGLLIDMERLDEAILLYRKVQEVRSKTWIVGAASRQQQDRTIEELREKLVEKGALAP